MLAGRRDMSPKTAKATATTNAAAQAATTSPPAPPVKRSRKKADAAVSAAAAAAPTPEATAGVAAAPVPTSAPAAAPTPAAAVTNEPASHIILQLPISSDRVQNIIDGAGDARVDTPSPYMPGHCWTTSCLEYETPPQLNVDPIVCFHCCHPITTKMYGMPIDFDSVHNLFHVYGHFCSLNCAAAFNMSTHMGSDRMWDIHSWLQMMAQVYQIPLPVRPAPSRYVLKMFGGPLSIEDFRASHQTMARTVVLNVPPLVSVQPQVEWVNTSFLASSVNAAAGVAAAAHPSQPAAAGDGATNKDAGAGTGAPSGGEVAFPKLSRKRAVVDSKRTLESKMNLTVSIAT